MILNETLDIIKNKKSLNKIKIQSIFFSYTITIIQLNDFSIGACQNYYKFGSNQEISNNCNYLHKKLINDPLLIKCLFDSNELNGKKLLKLSLKTCLINAFSKDLIRTNDIFLINDLLSNSIFENMESALIIGFGGYMEHIIRNTNINNIHISDLYYNNKKENMDKKIFFYKKLYPQKNITISNGDDNKETIKKSDLVSITGSALCNNTMDDLLDYAKNCKKIIVQGQSCCIYPKALFQRNVSLISTTIKPNILYYLAIRNYKRLMFLLEGKLPIIYISHHNKY